MENSDDEGIDDLIQRAQIIIEKNRRRNKKASDAALRRALLYVPRSEVLEPEILPATISSTENTPRVTEAPPILSLSPPTTALNLDLTLRGSESPSCIPLSPIRRACTSIESPSVQQPLTAAGDEDDVIFVAYEPAANVQIDLTTPNIPNKRYRRTSQMANDVVVIDCPPCAKTIAVTTPIADSPQLSAASECLNTAPSRQRLTLECPICMDSCRKPTSTFCGHIFCQQCIKQAVKISKKCPICKRKLTARAMHPLYI